MSKPTRTDFRVLEEQISHLLEALREKRNLLDDIEDWLDNEIAEGQEIVDAYNNKQDTTDLGDHPEIIIGWHECATALRKQIENGFNKEKNE